jgi:hypothetical protein
MKYPHASKIVWTFDTERFRVVCHFDKCEDDPRDKYGDASDENIALIKTGQLLWFDATVSVWWKPHDTSGKTKLFTCLGYDSLGQCDYWSVADFIAAHRDSDPMNRNCTIMRKKRGRNLSICHYFPDMVREAIKMARKTKMPLEALLTLNH